MIVAACVAAPLVIAALFLFGLKKKGAHVELPVLAAFFIPLVIVAWSWREALDVLRAALAGSDPAEKATGLAEAISIYFNTAFALCVSSSISAGLGSLAIGSSVQHRLRASSPVTASRVFLASLLAGGAIVVWCAGGTKLLSDLTLGFRAVAEGDPSLKAVMLKEISDKAFGQFSFIGYFGALIAVLSLGTGAAAAWSAPSITSRNAPIFTAFLLFGGFVLLIEVWPSVQENRAPPLPFSASGDLVGPLEGVAPPDLRGPDEVERAPVISVAAGVRIEGIAVKDEGDLASKLGEMRKVEEMMHPGAARRDLIWVVDAAVDGKQLESYVLASSRAGYAWGWFAFPRSGVYQRPSLGAVRWSDSTAVRFYYWEQSEGELEKIPLVEGERFEIFAKKAIEARKAGKKVYLGIDPEKPTER